MLQSQLFINDHLKTFYQHLERCLGVRLNFSALTTLEGLENLFEQVYYKNSYEIDPGSVLNISKIEKLTLADLYEKNVVIEVQPIPQRFLDRCVDN